MKVHAFFFLSVSFVAWLATKGLHTGKGCVGRVVGSGTANTENKTKQKLKPLSFLWPRIMTKTVIG